MSGPSRQGGLMAEINVTPFVDVMLVLLIIFMVTAPLMTTGVSIELPHAEAPPLTGADDQLVVGMKADETYTLHRGSATESVVTLEQLTANLTLEGKNHPKAQVFVSADGSLKYEKVMQLLALAKSCGIPQVGLVTQPAAPQ